MCSSDLGDLLDVCKVKFAVAMRQVGSGGHHLVHQVFRRQIHHELAVVADIDERVFFAAGAVLVLVAAIVFTVVSWGRLGEGGRVGVMLAFLGASTAVVVETHRRGLRWTAEAMAWLTASLAALETVAMTVYDIALHVDTVPVAVLCTGVAVVMWAILMGVVTHSIGDRHGRFPLAQP